MACLKKTLKTILIYGGTFDPPHKAHITMLKAAARKVKPSKIYLIPSWKSPFKDFPWTSFKDRAQMIKIALKESGLLRDFSVKIHPFEA